MNFTERKSRFLNGTTFSDLGTFTLLNILKVSLGKGPFLLAQTAQLQILILRHMGFTEPRRIVFELRCDLIDPNFNPVFDLSGF